MFRPTFLQYRGLLATLSTTHVSRPRTGPGISNVQMNDGTMMVREAPNPENPVADLYVHTEDGQIHEQLFVLDLARYLDQPHVYDHVSTHIRTIPADRFTQMKKLEAEKPGTVRFAAFPAIYLAFPEPGAIAALPDANPSVVKGSYLYDLRYHPDGAYDPKAPVTGRMYREKVVSNGKTSWHDHWVMYEDYYAPFPPSTVSVTPNRDPARPTTLKQFLSAQRTRFDTLDADTRSQWKYAPALYVLGPLPAQPPLQ